MSQEALRFKGITQLQEIRSQLSTIIWISKLFHCTYSEIPFKAIRADRRERT